MRERLREAREKLSQRGAKEINLTDEESTTMLHRAYRAEPSYNGQVAVEESNGVIVAADLSNNPADYGALVELVEQVEDNTGEKPAEVLGDSGYSSYENLQYLEERGITGYIPDQRMESFRRGTSQHPEFHRSRFRYDRGKDQYICPMGRLLPYQGSMKRKRKPEVRIYRCWDCPECGCKSDCTRAAYRRISVDPREHLMEKMRTRLETPEGRKKYSKRKYIVEPVFGDMKFNRKMGGMSLRGKLGARGEFLIMCIGHNLRKIAKYLSHTPPGPGLQPLMA